MGGLAALSCDCDALADVLNAPAVLVDAAGADVLVEPP